MSSRSLATRLSHLLEGKYASCSAFGDLLLLFTNNDHAGHLNHWILYLACQFSGVVMLHKPSSLIACGSGVAVHVTTPCAYVSSTTSFSCRI